ncbi:MAG: DEAD/DEAH box helicase [Candidatus Omnitrophota bacterium]
MANKVFSTFKLYKNKDITIEEVISEVSNRGYSRHDNVFGEGDFSVRGDTFEIFPVNFAYPVRVEWEFDMVSSIYSFDKAIHHKLIDYEFLILIPYKKKHYKYSSEDFPLDAVLKINKGDYVVHSRYGIGRFVGIKNIKLKDKQDNYFTVEYLGGDIVYIAKEDAHLLQKYMSFAAKPPKLSKLGSKEWIKIKERVSQKIKFFAVELLKMQAQRSIIGGHAYAKDSDWQKEFEERFEFIETPDQAKAIEAVKCDMESKECMDRIICGDVGYGKTEVAMRAAFKAVMDNKQVAFLVPTTILAYQHYTNLVKRLDGFPIKVEMLSRFKTHRQQLNIIKELKEGKIDIVVGTHRIVSGDVTFKDLGLLVIDEEHKFGVAYKERIKSIKVGIDVLLLSATPIPRTLHMGLIGIRNISMIKTPPRERLSVKTEIVKYDPKELAKVIEKEYARNGQVFFVHNRIEPLGKIEKAIRRNLSASIRLAAIHGRMNTHEIEKIMLSFINGDIDCLLSTAIVESGIDIPRANTIIINDAHMFGLADLHQLRGRVGRYNKQAYTYLSIPSWDIISSDARKRLEMLKEYSHLGAGFEVAMTDLEMRGAGNILGKEQHGFIWLVGFDMYCRLLKKEIEYLREMFKIGNN